MIEINLIKKKKSFRMPHVMGMDLGLINFKMLLIALLTVMLPEHFLRPLWDAEVKDLDNTIKRFSLELRKTRESLSKNKNIQQQLEAYNNQIQVLQERSRQVNQIIKSKSNPMLVLEKLARIIPEDMWFSTISITGKKEIVMQGQSFSYKSIGSFIMEANETLFFNKSLTLGDSKTIIAKIHERDVRTEHFEIKGAIANFSPWVK